MSDEIILLVQLGLMVIAAFSALFATLLFLDRLQRPRGQETGFAGSGFDASPLQPRLNAVRHDYTAALHFQPHPRFHGQQLLEAARESVLRLAYFQEREGEPE
jgi:hypothetical protein